MAYICILIRVNKEAEIEKNIELKKMTQFQFGFHVHSLTFPNRSGLNLSLFGWCSQFHWKLMIFNSTDNTFKTILYCSYIFIHRLILLCVHILIMKVKKCSPKTAHPNSPTKCIAWNVQHQDQSLSKFERDSELKEISIRSIGGWLTYVILFA